MRIIEIKSLQNGGHGNQSMDFEIPVPDGWAVIPDGAETPNFPFGTFEVDTVNGVPTMKNWVAGTMPEPVTPTLAEVQAAKLAEINAACTSAIAAGCDVTLSDGTAGHISLTPEDQINLTTAQTAIQGGASEYPYHLDGELCKIFFASDISIMARAATAYILYHTTYCNHVRVWVKRCETTADVEAITYGGSLPEDLAAHMDTVLGGSLKGETT